MISLRPWAAPVLAVFLQLFLSAPAYSVPGFAQPKLLTYKISGVSSELKQNILAYLSPPPETALEVDYAVARVKERVHEALHALGYYAATVTVEDLNGTAPAQGPKAGPRQLLLQITPGEPVRLRDIVVTLKGDAEADPAFRELVAESPLRSGDPLHHGIYRDFKRRLLALGQSRGYFRAQLASSEVRVNVAEKSADVSLVYASGPRFTFGDIEVDQALLPERLLAAVQPFTSGEPYDEEQLQELRNRLQDTEFFASVIVAPRLAGLKDARVPIVVELQPSPRHSFEVGIGYSTDIRERLSLVWRSPRLNAAGHSQESRVQWSPVNPTGGITYRIPVLDAFGDSWKLSAVTENNEYGDLQSKQIEFAVNREFVEGSLVIRAGARALREEWDVFLTDEHADYLLPGLSLSHRTRAGSAVDPRSGFSQYYSLEAASDAAGSESNLLRAYAGFALVATPARRHRFVGRAELGTLLGSGKEIQLLPPSLAFFAGGDQSIRGYAYQSIGNRIAGDDGAGGIIELTAGGSRLITGSVEYQYYLNEKWRAAFFVDAGDAFERNDFNLNVGAGFGVHYMTPVGPIKFEVANSVSDDNPDWRVHINIGAEL